MFVIPTNVGFTHRVVAMLVACALVLWSIGAYSTAQAANLTSVKNTLTDSAPSVTSGHDISFAIPAGSSLQATGTVSITFPSLFTGVSSLVTGNIAVTVNGTPDAHAAFTAVGQVVTFNSITASSTDTVRVVFAGGIVTNPAGIMSYEFLISTPSDSGRTRVAIVNTVLVTAVVDTTLNFVISGLGTTTSINGTSTTGSTTATAIPFGTLAQWGIKTLGQQLNVTTNARNGFVVTVEQDGNLQSTTGADIDGFIDGAYTNTPAVWASPTNSILNENTWGHWGLTSDDTDLNAGEFSGGKWVAASTTPRQIFKHTGPADGTTQDKGLAKIGYQIQVSPLQEAGDDYSTVLTYIATPTF